MWRLARLLLCKWGGWGSGKKDDDGKMRNIYNVRARGFSGFGVEVFECFPHE